MGSRRSDSSAIVAMARSEIMAKAVIIAALLASATGIRLVDLDVACPAPAPAMHVAVAL